MIQILIGHPTLFSTIVREEELKSLLMRVKKESERASLRLNIKKKNKKKLASWHPPPLLQGK